MRLLLLLAVLVGVACLALPVAALLLDGSDTRERLIVPLQVLLTVGAGSLLAGPVLKGEDSAARKAVTGAFLALVAAAVAISVFVLLLDGV